MSDSVTSWMTTPSSKSGGPRADSPIRVALNLSARLVCEACGKAHPLFRDAVGVDVGHQHCIGHSKALSGQDRYRLFVMAIIDA